jgi:hypothetical protein
MVIDAGGSQGRLPVRSDRSQAGPEVLGGVRTGHAPRTIREASDGSSVPDVSICDKLLATLEWPNARIVRVRRGLTAIEPAEAEPV